MTTAYPAGPRTGHDETQGIGELIGEVTSDLSRLFHQEMDLAKAELKQEAKKAGRAGGMFGVVAIAGLMVTVLLSFALVYALATIMPAGWAALIVAALWGVIGAVAFFAGRDQARSINPVPQQTVETLKEDAQWLRHPTG